MKTFPFLLALAVLGCGQPLERARSTTGEEPYDWTHSDEAASSASGTTGAGGSSSSGAGGALDYTVYLVHPSFAWVSPTDNGADWDSDGSPPDVLIAVECPSPVSGGEPITGQTPEQEGYSPSWEGTSGCVTAAYALLYEPIRFKAWDIDTAVNDPISGSLSYQLTAADLAAGGVSLDGGGALEGITFGLVAQ